MSKDWIFPLIGAAVIALCGWTLKKVNDLSVEMAQLESSEKWIVKVLEVRDGKP